MLVNTKAILWNPTLCGMPNELALHMLDFLLIQDQVNIGKINHHFANLTQDSELVKNKIRDRFKQLNETRTLMPECPVNIDEYNEKSFVNLVPCPSLMTFKENADGTTKLIFMHQDGDSELSFPCPFSTIDFSTYSKKIIKTFHIKELKIFVLVAGQGVFFVYDFENQRFHARECYSDKTVVITHCHYGLKTLALHGLDKKTKVAFTKYFEIATLDEVAFPFQVGKVVTNDARFFVYTDLFLCVYKNVGEAKWQLDWRLDKPIKKAEANNYGVAVELLTDGATKHQVLDVTDGNVVHEHVSKEDDDFKYVLCDDIAFVISQLSISALLIPSKTALPFFSTLPQKKYYDVRKIVDRQFRFFFHDYTQYVRRYGIMETSSKLLRCAFEIDDSDVKPPTSKARSIVKRLFNLKRP